MKICLIIDDFILNSIRAGAKMMFDLALEFKRMGHQVTILSPNQEQSSLFDVSEHKGVTICAFKTGPIKNVSLVKRAVNETLLSHQAWRLGGDYFRSNPHDMIVYYSPSIFWGILVSQLKSLWNAPAYLVLRDFFPQWVIDNGMLSKRSPVTLYFRFFEYLNYRSADVIGLQSPANLKWFSDNTSVNKRLEVLFNWSGHVPVIKSSRMYLKRYGLENKIVFFYGGNIGYAQDMMNIIRLAVRLGGDERAHFLLVGSGDEFELVENMVKEYKLNNITLLPPVSQEVYSAMLAESDIGLFTLHKNHSAHNFPGKLLNYMAQVKPILGSINLGNDLKGIIDEERCGLVSINGNDDEFYSNAVRMLNDGTLRETMGNNARRLLYKKFSVEAAAQTILKLCG